jgi:hypothetical protein
MAEENHHLEGMLPALERIATDMQAYHPKALLLFGSLARYLAGDPGDHPPNDIDLLVITGNPPISVINTDYGCRVALHRFTADRMVAIAKSLRYDSRPVALAKLYSRVVAKRHAIDVIAAAMMLGSAYGDFGIEQIEINGITDTRDYSIHRVLIGECWWQRLCRYARQRRGPLMRFSDMIVGSDRFNA